MNWPGFRLNAIPDSALHVLVKFREDALPKGPPVKLLKTITLRTDSADDEPGVHRRPAHFLN